MVEKAAFASLSFPRKAGYVWRHITVEPMLVLYINAFLMSGLTVQNFNLDKACRVNLGYNDTVCSALLAKNETGNYCPEYFRLKENMTNPDPWRSMLCDAEDAVQEKVTTMSTWTSYFQGTISAVLLPFIGSWTDRHRRRKPAIIAPIAGEILAMMGFLVCNYFFYEFPMEVSGLNEVFFPAFTGGWMTMYMATYSYLADVTSVESRTFRIGILNVSSYVSAAIGNVLSGKLYRLIHYYGVFSVASCLHIGALVAGMTLVKSGATVQSKDPAGGDTPKDATLEAGILPFLKDFFDLRHIWETVRVVFRKGKHNYRMRVILLMIVIFVVQGPWQGESALFYKFTRVRFSWTEQEYSMFVTFSTVTHIIGNAISVGLLSKVLKIDDALIGIISSASKICSCFIFAFATEPWMLYIAPIVDIADGTSYIAMRSIGSKLVPSDDLGKLNSVFGMAESMVPILYLPVYNKVYNATRKEFTGAFFLFGGALTAPAIFIFLWLYGQHRQDAARLAKTEIEMKNSEEMASEDDTVDTNNSRNGTGEAVKRVSSFTNEAFQQDVENSKL